jgi:hypothetical protein
MADARSKLTVVPCNLRHANEWLKGRHRHHGPTAGHGGKFALAVLDDAARLRGVCVVCQPVGRSLDDGWTLEVARLCTDGCPNACSALYGASWRVARAMGYRRMVTYTMPEEGGISLRASGWKQVAETHGKGWDMPGRFRDDKHPLGPKWRWEVSTADYEPGTVNPTRALGKQDADEPDLFASV